MARSFSSAYYTTANGAVGSLVNGASAVSVAAWVKFASTTSATVNDNRALTLIVGGSTAGVVLCLDNNSAPGEVRVRCGGRSVVGDSFTGVSGATNLSADTWYHLGAVMNFGSPRITVYVNGVSDGTAGVTFGNSTFTHSAASAADVIAAAAGGSTKLTGTLADVALWGSDIGSTGFSRLAAGDRPTRVSTSSLAAVFPLTGITSEADVKTGVALTASGSPSAVSHPSVKPLFSGAGAF